MECIEETGSFRERAQAHRRQTGRPYVTLTYAQSLDGAIASRPGHPLALSCRESQTMTHCLRAVHDAILVGIGTVLSDDPSLTVRLAPGRNPQPVVLDSRLRFPPYAKLLQQKPSSPWIFTSGAPQPERQTALERLGARIYALEAAPNGGLSLPALLEQLGQMGLNSLMVEGGAQIITSFLRCQAVDQMIVTIAPVLVGGVRVLDIHQPRPVVFPRLRQVEYRKVGDDLVVRGYPDWRT